MRWLRRIVDLGQEMPRGEVVGVITRVQAGDKILGHDEAVPALISAKTGEQHAAPELDARDHEAIDRVGCETAEEFRALPDIKAWLGDDRRTWNWIDEQLSLPGTRLA
jgi:hypothetical protein